MLSKDILSKLSLEQKEILAKAKFCKWRRRQKLLEQAHGRDWRSRYFPLYIFGVFLVFVTGFWFYPNPAIFYPAIGIMVASVISFHIARTNRRMDALMELLDLDLKEREDREFQTEQKAG